MSWIRSHKAAIPLLRSVGGHWLIALLIVVFGLAGVLARTLVNSRDVDLQRAVLSGESLARALESEVAGVISGIDGALNGVLEKLRRPDVMRAEPALRHLALFDRAHGVKQLNSLLVLNERGMLAYGSRGAELPAVSHANRDYFLHHAQSDDPGIYVGKPILGRTSGAEVVTLSRRISNSDGSFAGVVAASLRLDYFRDLFQSTTLGKSGNITLANADGTILMRWPLEASMIGRDASGAELFRHLEKSSAGAFETKTVIDGVHRLITYRQLAGLPLVLGVGQATDVIYAQWFQDAFLASAVVAGLCAIALVLAYLLYRELLRRVKAETHLVNLAQTDPLTGLYNRRLLDRFSEIDWGRLARSGNPVSLVMIDVDNFKDTNDRLGHPYGDEVLRRVARAIQAGFRPGVDLGVRFGGDEFAIVLPSSDAQRATAYVEKIRQALTEICADGLITVPKLSIGIASAIPDRRETFAEFFKMADAALYSAKKRGRNQMVLAQDRRVVASWSAAKEAA